MGHQVWLLAGINAAFTILLYVLFTLTGSLNGLRGFEVTKTLSLSLSLSLSFVPNRPWGNTVCSGIAYPTFTPLREITH